jgi:hypothetical protein
VDKTFIWLDYMMDQIVENTPQFTFFNVISSSRDDRDQNADMLFDERIEYPKTLDLRKYLQKIRNQGVQGTSLTQVGVCMLEWKSRKIHKEFIKLSPQYLYNTRSNKRSTLMCGRELMQLMKDNGCCTEKQCPYGNLETPSTEMNISAGNFRIKDFACVKTIVSLKRALTLFGPCLITFPVFNHTSYMWKQHKEEEKLGGHAMAVVGYTQKGFILRNSWGKYWELNGYCIYPYSDWGYHDEVWCQADNTIYEQWKSKAKGFTKFFTPKKHVRNSIESNVSSISMEKTYIHLPIPEPRQIISSEKNGHDSLESQFKNKDDIKTETNEMKKASMFSIFRKLPDQPSKENSTVENGEEVKENGEEVKENGEEVKGESPVEEKNND